MKIDIEKTGKVNKKVLSKNKFLRNFIIIGFVVLILLFVFAVFSSLKKEADREDGLASIWDIGILSSIRNFFGFGGGPLTSSAPSPSDTISGDDWEFGPITPDPSAGSTTIDPEFRCQEVCTPSSDSSIPEMPDISGMAVDECFTFCEPGGRGPRPKEYSLVKNTQIARYEANDPALTPKQIAEKICLGEVDNIKVPGPGGGPLGSWGWARTNRGSINKPHIHAILGKIDIPSEPKPYFFTDGAIEFDDEPSGGELHGVPVFYPVAPGDGKIIGINEMSLWQLKNPAGRARFTSEQLEVLDLVLEDTERHERGHWAIFSTFDISYVALANAQGLSPDEPNNKFASQSDAEEAVKDAFTLVMTQLVFAERTAHNEFDFYENEHSQNCPVPDLNINCPIYIEAGQCPSDYGL